MKDGGRGISKSQKSANTPAANVQISTFSSASLSPLSNRTQLFFCTLCMTRDSFLHDASAGSWEAGPAASEPLSQGRARFKFSEPKRD